MKLRSGEIKQAFRAWKGPAQPYRFLPPPLFSLFTPNRLSQKLLETPDPFRNQGHCRNGSSPGPSWHRVRQDGPPRSATHSALVALLETSDSDVSLLRGGSRWVLAKHTKGACSLSQQPRAPKRRSTRGAHSGFRLIIKWHYHLPWWATSASCNWFSPLELSLPVFTVY